MKKLITKLFSVALIASAPITLSFTTQEPQRDAGNPRSVRASAAIEAEHAPGISVSKEMGGRSLDRRRTVWGGIIKEQTMASVPKPAAPARAAGATGDYPEIFGAMLYSEAWGSSLQFGLYSVPTSSATAFTKLYPFSADCSYGGALVDNIYYFNSFTDIGVFQYYESFGINIETGHEVFYSDNTSDPVLAQGMDTDPLTNTVYGIFYNPVSKKLSLGNVVYANNRAKKTIIAELGNDWYTAFAIASNGTFYAIKKDDHTGEGILGTMNRATGEFTKIGNTGQYPYYISGMVFDRSTDRLFWALNPADDTGYLVELDVKTGASTLVYNFPNNEEIAGMYILVPEALDGAPAECGGVTVDFNNDSLTGKVNLTAPTKTYGGSTLDGKVDIHILANGEEVYKSTGIAPGASISADVTLKTPGFYSFTVFASNGAGNSPKTRIKEMWIGPDTPKSTKATAVYANGKMKISWEAVTQGINGGYLDLSKLAYTIKDLAGNVVASNVKTTTYSFDLPEPDKLTAYCYTVTVTAGDIESAGAKTNTIVLGSIMPPYTADFLSEINGYTIINANNDMYTWVALGNGSMGIAFNNQKAMDDWLITPPIKLEAGKGYVVSFVAGTEIAQFPEAIEVKYGKANTVEAMTNTLVAKTTITEPISNGGTTFTQTLFPDEAGTYYIGFHGVSSADSYYLYLKDFQIETGVSTGAPDFVTELTATPAKGGVLECNVSFKAPTKTLGGATLSSITSIDLYRGETLVNTFASPAPGASLSFKDVNVPAGDVTYTVVANNSAGPGMKARVSAFVGFQKPEAPASVTVKRTNVTGEISATWDAVTKDLGGETLTANDVTYTLCVYNNGWEPVVENLKTTTYTYRAVSAGEQEFVQLAVFAKTVAGTGEGTTADMIPVGTPYNGMNETFANAELQYIWGYNQIGTCFVNIYDDESFANTSSVTGDNGFIGILANEVGFGGNLYSGLISLKDMENPGLSFYTSNINGNDTNTILVSVKTSDSDEWEEVMPTTTINKLYPGVEGWFKTMVPLKKYAGKTVQVQITGIVQGYKNIFFDDIKVAELPDYDLAVKNITSPASVDAGESFDVKVKVANEGVRAAEAYAVELYENGKLVDTKNMGSLASGAEETVSFKLTMSPIASEVVEYYANVVYATDEDMTNNRSATIKVTPIESTLPAPSNLEAELVEQTGVKLKWDAPDLSGGVTKQVVDDFEDADGVAAEYGDWLFVDVDKVAVGGIKGITIPGITSGITKGSFWVWDNNVMQGNSSYTAHSGSKFIFSLYRADGKAADDWAVSPLLSGQAQTISFYARSLSSDYPEAVQVLWTSVEDIDAGNFKPESFSSLRDISPVPAQWTLYEVDVPVNAKHFALRSHASNSFMLMIDDITYTVGGTADIKLEGYNIYRDGVKINSSPVKETEYVDTDIRSVAEGEAHTYVVTAVYTVEGESAGTNVVTIGDASGVNDVCGATDIYAAENGIVILNAEGQRITIVSVNGTVVYSGVGEVKTVVGVASGVYVVKVGNIVKKVLVR